VLRRQLLPESCPQSKQSADGWEFQLELNSLLTLNLILLAGRDDDFVGIENDTLPDFTQLEHFINSDNDEHNK
jgi:hypothetical protein